MPYIYLAEKIKKRYPSLTPGVDWDVVADSNNTNISIVWRVKGIPAPTKEDIDSQYTDDDILSERNIEVKNEKSSTLPTAVEALARILETRLGLTPNTLINEIKSEIKK